jgi:glycerol uptake facilitator-like aquaporin
MPIFGSLFQIGWAYALGIAFAIIIFAPVSGGHFNPAVTICLAIWLGVSDSFNNKSHMKLC